MEEEDIDSDDDETPLPIDGEEVEFWYGELVEDLRSNKDKINVEIPRLLFELFFWQRLMTSVLLYALCQNRLILALE
jgi:hypothetical protein